MSIQCTHGCCRFSTRTSLQLDGWRKQRRVCSTYIAVGSNDTDKPLNSNDTEELLACCFPPTRRHASYPSSRKPNSVQKAKVAGWLVCAGCKRQIYKLTPSDRQRGRALTDPNLLRSHVVFRANTPRLPPSFCKLTPPSLPPVIAKLAHAPTRRMNASTIKFQHRLLPVGWRER